ncbi:2-dehydropantoate 2-reductase [Psychrobium sp. MM17-31]|uniref:2-dehydropantoate 2-reductase n=1 Tax=Psychrobium sp. MM17-31 TaxID=2917758 RepID=UPI001EF57A3F|nr:2-dehydropantoate 2-reductase [Psychrobium sp. MM17-31]MCG7532789.1 2-dehydropantoate 2-reductase [Psychrobium sp. MM17-31]
MSDLNIVIVGAGSIGCYLGGCLIAAGAEVTLVGRERMRQQIAEHGLRVTDWQGRDSNLSSEQVSYSLDMSSLQDADVILVTVKSGDTRTVAQEIEVHASPQALVVSLQNGVSNVDVLKEYLPKFNVLAAMVPFNVLSKGDGHFHCGTEGSLALADPDNLSQLLIDALATAQLSVDTYDDLTNVQWTKLLLNLNNAINALSGIPLLEQLSNRAYRLILAQAISEALAVYRAAGITPVKSGKVIPQIIPHVLSLPTWLYKIVASSMLKIDPTARSSMYEDFVLGRKTEIDYLNGAIVKLAQQQGLNAPVNSAVTGLVKENELGGASPKLSPQTILKAINSIN